MSKSRPELCREISSNLYALINHTEQLEGDYPIFERIRSLALDLMASANIANYRNPSAFSQIDQIIRSIHSILHYLSENEKVKRRKEEHFAIIEPKHPIEKALGVIDELFVDMWGVSVADQIEREHETRLKASDMVAQPQQPDGLVQIVDGRPVRKTRIH